MPQYCKLSRSRILRDSFTIASPPRLDFLVPALHHARSAIPASHRRSFHHRGPDDGLQAFFYGALREAALCKQHKKPPAAATSAAAATRNRERRHISSTARRPDAASLRHQRFDSKGRMIIETTGPRQPAYSMDKYGNYDFVDAREQHFAASSKLPPSFFFDVDFIRNLVPKKQTEDRTQSPESPTTSASTQSDGPTLEEQLKLLQSVRELEEKLARAREDLSQSLKKENAVATAAVKLPRKKTLTKKDYLNLVDLYFYSHNSRFLPEASDESPTPIILNDYSFTLSSDFTKGDRPETLDDAQDYVSPLKEIEEQMKQDKLREIAVMQVFVDLLLDDESPNRALYEAYQELPQPGVAYLPKGVIRLLLQRMSVPWVKTQASMLRYLSLIDDMQQAKLPINVAEWSSAVYLAGRSFSRIDLDEVRRAFAIWQQMEKEAGVKSSHVTFNILFDVAVRAGKFALGETILTEMHKRNLRLNRMGRVSLMFYHGLRGDGDGVRKAYHDFVEAGEIVDTLVMNCVIASLINAQEPAAAEQIYQRMKDMQKNFRKGWTEAGDDVLFKLHPEPGSNRLGDQMASNSLGRILSRAPSLRERLPEHHQELQASMPLTPNFTTFRIMLAYHSSVSGDLDRMTVLLKEMLEDFDIPLFPVVFQLLFKGFAIHGPQGGSDSPWSKKRLDMTWQACRKAIIDASNPDLDREVAAERDQLTLPSITDVNSGMSTVKEAEATGKPKGRVLSMWEELVVDLAAFPRERLKRLQRFASTQFDDVSPEGFHSPFFQDAHYSAPQPELDEEEGEYTLPDPIQSTLSNPNYKKNDPYFDDDQSTMTRDRDGADADEYWDRPPTAPHEGLQNPSFSQFNRFIDDPRMRYRLKPSKPLVCWLLRAYTRMTNSRAQVEEVWGAVRKIWRPKDDVEARHVIRVLMRCLRDCDRMNGLG